MSARGGDLLNRTLENYHRPEREAERLRANTEDSDEEDSTSKTPSKMDVDDGSNTGRVTRGEDMLARTSAGLLTSAQR